MLAAAQTLTKVLDGVKEWVEAAIAPDLVYLVPPDDGAVEGIEIVDRIAGVSTDFQDRPMTPQVIESMTVETFGVEFGEPEKIC